MIRNFRKIAAALAIMILAGVTPSRAPAQRAVPAEIRLDQLPLVYGLSATAGRPAGLFLATPLGLFRGNVEGRARIVEGMRDNLMAFAVHPGNPRILLAGGHPGRSGSIGVMQSRDGGEHWTQLSREAAGHVGFHFLEMSGADPNTVYGVTNGLRVSKDGGRTWTTVGRVPTELIHFAASAADLKTVYAATRQGLLLSRDQGVTWQSAGAPAGLASMVHVTPKGGVYAFVLGRGLLRAEEGQLRWKTVASDFADRILLRMAQHPTDSRRLYAATVTGAVVTSSDGGKHWISYEGSQNATPKVIAKGKVLFDTYCQACHGAGGRGQQTTPGFNPSAPPPIMAPALDDSAHAWHHPDEGLTDTILNGSPRQGSPMIPWKNVVSRQDAAALVAYIKSLWNFRSIACQGARHMSCMRSRGG